MKTLYSLFLALILALLTASCAKAQHSIQTAHFDCVGQTLPEIRHINDMKVVGDTLFFVYESADSYGQHILRRAIINKQNKQLVIGSEIGKREGGYYVSYMPYPFVGTDRQMHVISQDDSEIYNLSNDSVLSRTKKYLFDAIVPFPISQYAQDVFMAEPEKYVFIGREPKGGTQYAMRSDMASARIDTIRQIAVSSSLTAWMPNAGELAFSSKHNKLAFAYRLHPVIEIFGMDGAIKKTLRIGEPTFDPATLDMADFETLNKQYFVDVTSNDEYIYALHWGHKYEEQGQSTIYQIDWDGNIIAKHTISDDVYKIAILDNSTIIGYTGREFVLISI